MSFVYIHGSLVPGSARTWALVPNGIFTRLRCTEASGSASPASVGVAASVAWAQSKRVSQAYPKLPFISGTLSKAVAGAVKETSQGTFAKGVDTKWPEARRASDVLKSSPKRQPTVSVPPRG